MQLYLPIAEISVNVFLLLGLGGVIGFLSGLFGVGGGLIIVPALVYSFTLLDFPVATLTQLAIGSFSETAYEGIGFGLGFAVNTDEVASGQIGRDDYYWGGAASTIFSVDPHEDLIIIFLTQLMPSSTFNFRGQLKSIVYGAIDD